MIENLQASMEASHLGFLFNLGSMIVGFAIVLGFVMLLTVFLIYVERKIWAYMQIRLGPMNVGPKGILQPVADGLKLFIKEDVIPDAVDRKLFSISPIIVLVPAIAAYVVIPFGKGLIYRDLNIGILFILAISSIEVLGVICSGWSSNNKYSLLGAMRSAAQIVSYEIPAILAILPIILIAGSLSMNDIVADQSGWLGVFGWNIFKLKYCWIVAISFLIFLTASLAELNRTPFDLPEADSELVAGYNTEYSGMKFAFFFLAEWMNVFLVSAIAVTLFFGGWMGPGVNRIDSPMLAKLLSFIYFFGKCWVVMFVIIWIRATYPRLRIDQLMDFTWKALLPMGLALVLGTGFIAYGGFVFYLIGAAIILGTLGILLYIAKLSPIKIGPI